MGTSLDKVDVAAKLDQGTGEAFCDLHFGIPLPMKLYPTFSTLMYEERYIEARDLVLGVCEPGAKKYVEMFFGENLIARSKPAPLAVAAE